jgi:hypothetical protein
MSYKYEEQKSGIFTDEGQKLFLGVRDKVARLLKESGAFMLNNVLTGDSWQCIACVDRMVELGDLTEVVQHGVRGQDRVFVQARRDG